MDRFRFEREYKLPGPWIDKDFFFFFINTHVNTSFDAYFNHLILQWWEAVIPSLFSSDFLNAFSQTASSVCGLQKAEGLCAHVYLTSLTVGAIKAAPSIIAGLNH